MTGTLQNGQVIGPYRVEQILGDGHFGVVYLVKNQQTAQRFALKELKQSNPAYITGFFREATILQMTNGVADSNVIKYVYQFEYNHIQFLVMEFAEGVSLTDLSQGVISESTLANIATQISKGLVVLHNNTPTIIHRDIKPENVRVSIKGNLVKAIILDVGIAALLDGIHTFGPGGSPRFAHPLQLKKGVAYHYMDQHSLGATLFYLMMSQVSQIEDELLLPFPFEKWNGLAEQQAVISTYPKAFQKLISDVHGGTIPLKWDAYAQAKAALAQTKFSAKLQAFVLKMISYKETDQFASMSEVLQAFTKLQSGSGKVQVAVAQPAATSVGKRVPTATLTNPPTVFMSAGVQAIPSPVLAGAQRANTPAPKQQPAPQLKTVPSGKKQGNVLTNLFLFVVVAFVVIVGLHLLGSSNGTITNVTPTPLAGQAVALTSLPVPTQIPSVRKMATNAKAFLAIQKGNEDRSIVWSPDSTQIAFYQSYPEYYSEVREVVMNAVSGDMTIYPYQTPENQTVGLTWPTTTMDYLLDSSQMPSASSMGVEYERVGIDTFYLRKTLLTGKSEDYDILLAPYVLSWDKKHVAFIIGFTDNLYVVDVHWDPIEGHYALGIS